MAECRRPERIFMGIGGVKDIMAGDVHDYEPWFRDDKVEICGIYPPGAGPV